MPKHQPKIAIIIIHYNTPHYLKSCLDHIFNQSYKNIDVYFIDNNSPDPTGLNFVKKDYKHQAEDKRLIVIPNKENLGYARAANQGIHLATDADYIVITNPDIIYSPTYFEKIIARIERVERAAHSAERVASNKEHNNKIAGITGKVYKYDFKNARPTKTIDTVGLCIDKAFRTTDRGQGEEDHGQFDEEKEVFGISGACPLYRRSALEDAAIDKNNPEYFDEDFFMYKEDVDLSWRLQLLGHSLLYYPKAIAFHGRGTGVIERRTLWQIFRNRKNLSKFQRYYSFRNHNFMLLKNLTWSNYLRNIFTIIPREILKAFYVLIFEPFVLKSFKDYIKLFPKMLKKRRAIMKKRKSRKVPSNHINKFQE